MPASQRSCVQLIYARRISDVTLDNIEQYVLKWPEPDVFSELHAFTYLTLGSNVPEDIFVRCALRLKYCGANRKHSPTYADDCDLLARRVTDIKFCTPSIIRAQGIPSVMIAYKLCRQWDEREIRKWFHVQHETKRDMIRWHFMELRIPTPVTHYFKRYTASLGRCSGLSGVFQSNSNRLRC